MKSKSSTTIETGMFIPTQRRPTDPGAMLSEEFIKPLGLTQQQLADALGVTRVRINEIVNGRRGITADTALRLAKALRTTPDFWLNLQLACELYDAIHSPRAKGIAQIRSVVPAA